MLKGDLWSTHPDLQVVDVSHSVNRFDSAQAAYILADVLRTFPADTIHIVGVNASRTPASPHRCACILDQWVVASDRPFFGLLQNDLGGVSMELWNLPEVPSVGAPNFPEREVFVPVARQLLDGKRPRDLSWEPVAPVPGQRPFPREEGQALFGQVIYVDGFDNAVTNIDRATFDRIRRNRSFHIVMRGSRMDIKRISVRYDEHPPGERLALFNQRGLLEIAVAHHNVPGHHGGASSLLGLPVGHAVQIVFEG